MDAALAERIKRLRIFLLVHSYIYYHLPNNGDIHNKALQLLRYRDTAEEGSEWAKAP